VPAAHLDLREHVFVAGGLAGFVDVDHRAVDVEERDHLGRTGLLVDDQRVNLARRLVDERTLAGDPVVFEVSPRPLDDVAGNPRGVDVSRQHAALAHAQQVAPAPRHGVQQQRPEPHAGRLRHPDTLVGGNRLDGDLGLDAGQLDDHQSLSRRVDVMGRQGYDAPAPRRANQAAGDKAVRTGMGVA